MGLLFYYTSGVLGILRVITSLGYFDWNRPVVLFAVFLCCTGIWLMGMAGKRYALLTMGVLVLCCVLLAVNHGLLREQCMLAWLVFQEPPGTFFQVNLTPVLVLSMALLAVFLYWLSLIVKKGWLFYPVTALLVAAEPYLGGQPDLTAIWLLAFFHLGDRVAASGVFPGQKNMLRSRRQIIARGGGRPVLLMLPVTALCMVLAFCLTTGHRELFFQFPLKMEQEIRQSMRVQQQLRSAAPVRDEGRISRGNRQCSGTDMVALHSSVLPEETLYLKQFTGSRYDNDRWIPAAEEAFLETLTGNQTEPADSLAIRLHALPFTRTAATGRKADGRMAICFLTAQQAGLVPYFSQALPEEDGVSRYQWYLRQTVLETAGNVNVPDTDSLWQAYESYVHETYTQVDEQRFPGLSDFCRSHPADSVEEATKQITQILTAETEYTLTPGVFPPDREIPEYFLLEGRKGYCVHFATTAVLMYRMYGIPARYAVGYIAPASAFLPLTDGSWDAVLPDSLAHAWPEIYLDGVGWMPVEVTPARAFEQILSGRAETENRQEDEGHPYPEETEETDEPETNAETASGTETEEPETEPETGQSVKPDSGQDDNTGFRDAGSQNPGMKHTEHSENRPPRTAVFCLLAAVSVFCLLTAARVAKKILTLRRDHILKQQQTYDVLRLFERLCQVLKTGGFEIDTTAGAMACVEQLSRIPGFSHQRAREVMAAVDRAAFGNGNLTAEQELVVRETYENACWFVIKGLSPVKKWYFRYIKVYR